MSKVHLPKGCRKRKSVQLALELGWSPDGCANNGHLRFRHPVTGRAMFLPSSPSDWRTEQNEKCHVKRVTRAESEKIGAQ